MNIFQIFVDNDVRWSTRVLLFLGFEAGEMYSAFVILLCKKNDISNLLLVCRAMYRQTHLL